jgi:hypothetical protein
MITVIEARHYTTIDRKSSIAAWPTHKEVLAVGKLAMDLLTAIAIGLLMHEV